MGLTQAQIRLRALRNRKAAKARAEVAQLLQGYQAAQQLEQNPGAEIVLQKGKPFLPQEEPLFEPKQPLFSDEDADNSFLGWEEPTNVGISASNFYGGGALSKVRVSQGSRPGSSGIRLQQTTGTSGMYRDVQTYDSDSSSCESNNENEDVDVIDEIAHDKHSHSRASSIRRREALLGKSALHHLSKKRQTCDGASGNAVMGTSIIQDMAKLVACPECGHHDLSLDMSYIQLDTLVKLTCPVCDNVVYEHMPSKIPNTTMYPHTAGIVASSMSIGTGYAGVRKIIENSNLSADLSSHAYLKYQSQLGEQMKGMCADTRPIVNECVRQHYSDIGRYPHPDSNVLDVDVSYDGSWQTRGFQSNIGSGFVIEAETGFVLDHEVLSKFCIKCKRIRHKYKANEHHLELALQEHRDSGDCDITHTGTSGAMETKCAENMWGRSEELNGMRYTTFISDGDSSAYNAVKELDPYEGAVIEKQECINHVAKRLGTRLRKLKSDSYTAVVGSKKRESSMAGRGKLTDEIIDRLSSYFGIGVRVCVGLTVDAMRKRITAGFKHVSSTDEAPQHDDCPTDAKSYCFYNAAKAVGKTPESHKEMKVKCKLSPEDCQKVLGVYADLTKDELLHKCLSGRTQNPNESLHAKVWAKLPKHKQFGLRRVESLTALTVVEHNMGYGNADVMGRLVNEEKTTAATHQQKTRDSLRIHSASQEKTPKRKRHRPISQDKDYGPGQH